MNRREYRQAFDKLSFSPDFEDRAKLLLKGRLKEFEKETPVMLGKTKKTIIIAAACIAALTMTAFAAAIFLSPAQVAGELEHHGLSAAFENKDAIEIGEIKSAGDYTVSLLGMADGSALKAYESDVEAGHVYVVAALYPSDGTELDSEKFQPFDWTITPLVEGYRVNAVNNWTLNARAQFKIIDGKGYYIMDIENLEIFSDHKIYLAIYQGGAPSIDLFSMDEAGAIYMRNDVIGAMFTLPIDPDKADPDAAEALVKGLGMDYWPITDEELEVLKQEESDISAQQDDETIMIIDQR